MRHLLFVNLFLYFRADSWSDYLCACATVKRYVFGWFVHVCVQPSLHSKSLWTRYLIKR